MTLYQLLISQADATDSTPQYNANLFYNPNASTTAAVESTE